jgi:hypothetical protein
VIARLSVGTAAAGLCVLVGWAAALVSPPSREWALVWAGGALALLPAAVAVARRRFDVFEPVHLFALSFAALFVARPSFDLARGSDLYWLGYQLQPTYARALAVGVVGAAGFYLGYYLPFGHRLAGRLPLPRSPLSPGALHGFIAFLTSLSLVLFARFVVTSGGLGVLEGRGVQRETAVSGVSGYLYASPFWLVSLGILLLALAPTWRSPRAAVGFGLLLFSQAMTLGGGDRTWTLPVLSAVILTRYLRRGRRPSLAAVAVLLVAAFTFGVTVQRDYRNVADRNQSLGQVVKGAVLQRDRSVRDFFEGADTAMVDDLAIELQFVPSRMPYERGSTYAEALARPVPRALWPGKPQPADSRLMQQIWPQFAHAGVGFAFSFFGEPYLNFGLAGALVVAALFGVAWKALYRWFARDPGNPVVVALFALNWPFLFVYMRGGLGVDYHRQLMCVLPLLAAVLVARVRRPRAVLYPVWGLD